MSLKRYLVSLLLTALGLQLVPAFAIAAFKDVSTSFQYSSAIEALEEKSIIAGYDDGTFRPLSTINRAEFSKIVALMVASQTDAKDCTLTNDAREFSDVPVDAWYRGYICVLRNAGAIGGYPDGTFGGEKLINFVEAAKIVAAAFGQNIQSSGGQWYEPFALALESSAAIPSSVKQLDSLLTRGEMAEIIWRLTEKKTDLASKSYLNLKHPELRVALGGDAVVTATSCADLRVFATEAQAQSGAMHGGDVMFRDGAPAPTMAESANKATNGGTGGGSDDYSQTNVQVAGVDEADIVKTDGTNLYIVSRAKGTVRIVKATPASAMKQLSEVKLSNDVWVSEIYVENGKLVLIGHGGNYGIMPVPMARDTMEKSIAPPWYGGQSRTIVKIFDVSNPENPKDLRTLTFEGNQISSRRIGNTMYLVTQKGMYWGGPVPLAATEKDLLPLMSDTAKGGSDMPVSRCGSVMILPRVPSPEYLAVSTIPLGSSTAEVKTSVIVGSAQNVYASAENLYVSAPQWSYVWDSANAESYEKTRIYRFAFTNAGVELEAQGDIPGHILNQFSMDEADDTFRVATTVNQNWMDENSRSSNHLYVLDMEMNRLGSVNDIAPGETIYSARFLGDRAYMVTFQTVDPFFVIDLKDPRNPKILGALKIPGYSNYLHPYDENHVIGFGKEVDASIDADKVHSDDAIYYTAIQGMKMSMFDVSDVSNPKEMWKTVIGDRGTESPLLNDHKALLFDKERGFLAFPITVTKRPDGSPKSADGNVVFQGAHVYDVSLTKGFTLRGTISHEDDPSVYLKGGMYWYGGDKEVQRIVRLGDSLLTVSEAQVRSHTLSNVTQQGKAELQ